MALPYTFVKRKKPEKSEVIQFHNKLLPEHYDIAFDVTWTTITTTALNPCIDETVEENCPAANTGDEYSAYDKRWLMIDKKLAISPFTVKSAIANGFSNLLGSCYRVNSKVEPHPATVKDGQYYYNGKYKRYRVSMGNSKPGIIKSIVDIPDSNIKKVEIFPVTEYLYKPDKPEKRVATFIPGERYFAKKVYSKKKKKEKKEVCRIINIRASTGTKEQDEIEVVYHDEYKFGMNTDLRHGDLGKQYQHRFYTFDSSGLLTGEIDKLNFESADSIKDKVYMGKFKPSQSQRDRRHEGGFWYEDLSKSGKGDFIYYQLFKDSDVKIKNIGKNFQFKALFCHEDTIPEGFEECNSIEDLCPRCRLFGMTEKKDNKEKPVGYKGRFKSSVLINNKQLTQGDEDLTIPYYRGTNDNTKNITVKKWLCNGETIAKQFLLPIQATPKPNKRDINGYFEENTGNLKGSKIYRNDRVNVRNLVSLGKYIKKINNKTELNKNTNFKYAHKSRNYAQVCDENINFSGVIGAENASIDEIAALFNILETGYSGNAFKIGLGKSFGMGCVESKINKIWIRNMENNGKYEWSSVEILDNTQRENLLKTMDSIIPVRSDKPAVSYKITELKEIVDKINGNTIVTNNNSGYPPPEPKELKKYWGCINPEIVI